MVLRVNSSQIEKEYSQLQLEEKEERELQECFDLFDEQKTGKVNPREIKKALESLGLDDRNRHVKVMLSDLVRYCEERSVDLINFKEFVVIVTDKLGDIRTERGQRKLFDLYDQNGDGYIDCDEIAQIAQELSENMTKEDIKVMIHHVHVLNRTSNLDKFNFEEFKEIIAHAQSNEIK